ncbi:hypothetical protein BKA83DRAFT_4504113 [Pisolithus microcarpus]|nr:hypothetical protein BKA83DRAFT_4504113 [Pisolithus microcarpus]
MTDSYSSTDQSNNADNTTATAWKQQISELEEELKTLRGDQQRTFGFMVASRCIWRLVSLTARVEDLVGESDRCTCLDDFEDQHMKGWVDRLFKVYNKLLDHQPSLRKVFESGELREIVSIFKELNRGADAARGDDATSLKPVVVHWLTSAEPVELVLKPDEKDGRGFDHEVTGCLLCPVDYDWHDPNHRKKICDYHPDFLVTAHSWPTFLYENEKFDLNRPSNGLFKGRLLVKAFKQIFMSPTSILKMDNEPHPTKRQRHDEQRTHSHVASLLGMKSVSPRAVAYVAVQLRFTLSDCGSWWVVDGEFNYEEFHYNIVDFFEDAETPGDKKIIRELLLWWNW